jgi:hypothetical protein
MKTLEQQFSLQNFANKFNLVVDNYYFNDNRKKSKFILKKANISVSPPLNYDEMNLFLLGINSTKDHNI